MEVGGYTLGWDMCAGSHIGLGHVHVGARCIPNTVTPKKGNPTLFDPPPPRPPLLPPPAAGNAFCQAAQLHLQLQSKHDAATNFVDAGNAFKKADPQGELNWGGPGGYWDCPGGSEASLGCWGRWGVVGDAGGVLVRILGDVEEVLGALGGSWGGLGVPWDAGGAPLTPPLGQFGSFSEKITKRKHR